MTINDLRQNPLKQSKLGDMTGYSQLMYELPAFHDAFVRYVFQSLDRYDSKAL